MKESGGKSKMVELAGLYLKETEAGDPYFVGNLNGASVWIFKNTEKKKGSNQPDYRLLVSTNYGRKNNKKKRDDDDGSNDGPRF